jgi:hypothetical protein
VLKIKQLIKPTLYIYLRLHKNLLANKHGVINQILALFIESIKFPSLKCKLDSPENENLKCEYFMKQYVDTVYKNAKK